MSDEIQCSQCPLRAKYDERPKSFAGRFWRWHIKFCPGWKKFMASLDDTERKAVVETYGLRK